MGKETRARTDIDPGYRHFRIVPDDNADLPEIPRVVFCQEPGTIVIRDEAGVDLPYAMQAGQWLPFHPVRVPQTGTTGVFYAWL